MGPAVKNLGFSRGDKLKKSAVTAIVEVHASYHRSTVEGHRGGRANS